MLTGLYYRDSPDKIEDVVNQSFHLFRDLLIHISGNDTKQDNVAAFYEKAEEVQQVAREIVELQSSDDAMDYAEAHLRAGDKFYYPLLDAIREYDPEFTDSLLDKIYDMLADNHTFIIARPTARKWDLSLIDTQASLDIVSEGIEHHKAGKYSEFHQKYKHLLLEDQTTASE